MEKAKHKTCIYRNVMKKAGKDIQLKNNSDEALVKQGRYELWEIFINDIETDVLGFRECRVKLWIILIDQKVQYIVKLYIIDMKLSTPSLSHSISLHLFDKDVVISIQQIIIKLHL